MASNLVFFTHHGNDVTFDPAAKMWSLTAMHQAAGGEPHKAPAKWLDNAQTAEYLQALLKYPSHAYLVPPRPEGGRNGRDELVAWVQKVRTIATEAGLIETRRGGHGGTWAHWQIAAAYAHYLQPEFYLQWNEWAMERVTGPGQPDDSRLTAIESRLDVIETRLTTQDTSGATSALHAPLPPEAIAVVDEAALTARADALAMACAAARWQQSGHTVTRMRSHADTQAILACFLSAEDGTLTPAALCAEMERTSGTPVNPAHVSPRLRRLTEVGMLVRLRCGIYTLNRAALDTDPSPPDASESLAVDTVALALELASARLRQNRHDIPRRMRNLQTQMIIGLLRAEGGPLTISSIVQGLARTTETMPSRVYLCLLLRRLAAAGLLVRLPNSRYTCSTTQ